VKFTPEGGMVTLRAEPDGAMVRFAVADTGPGISTDELPYVFDRYYQARRRNRDGIGLGLSIARGIVEAHGGRIWVESPTAVSEGKPTTGTTFFFTLPAPQQ
jgi:two-component system, chemotaxis family, sensor kinase Cph1